MNISKGSILAGLGILCLAATLTIGVAKAQDQFQNRPDRIQPMPMPLNGEMQVSNTGVYVLQGNRVFRFDPMTLKLLSEGSLPPGPPMGRGGNGNGGGEETPKPTK